MSGQPLPLQSEPEVSMGDLVKQVLTRLNYEQDDYTATLLLSAIFANDELAVRIATGPVMKR